MLGDYFGILMDARVTGFPFNVTDNPMYHGSTLSFLGTALWFAKPAGIILSVLVFSLYTIALRFEEYAFLVICINAMSCLTTRIGLLLERSMPKETASEPKRRKRSNKISAFNLDHIAGIKKGQYKNVQLHKLYKYQYCDPQTPQSPSFSR